MDIVAAVNQQERLHFIEILDKMMNSQWMEQLHQGHLGELTMKAAYAPKSQILADWSLQAKSKGSQHHQVDETTQETKVLSRQHMTRDAGTHA